MSVSGSEFPYLPIRIRIVRAGSIEQELDLEPLVDTGFDGGVCVPHTAIDPSITPSRHLLWQLADGSDVLTPAYLAYVQVGTLDPVQTVVIALGDAALLGREVTNHFRLIFDHGQRVLVEP